ncbi:uncharacterized protein PAC_09447 [Phialocephala subalpina]|uniref:Uncharacterized protein n=1 Tax=Phialocephala subalpina TaxID=576137 RepID=A0A1L7X3E6_9HELO|nr:uncharacterized protein PAC_09447 [Phialocephala subalpina]
MAQPDIDTGMPIIKMETEEGEGIYASTSRFSRREQTDQGLTLPPKIQSSDAWRFDPAHAITDEEFEALLGSLRPEPLISEIRDEEWLRSLFTDDFDDIEEPPRKRRKTNSPRRQSRATSLRVNQSFPSTAPPIAQQSVPSAEPPQSPIDSGYGTSISSKSSISGSSFNGQVSCDSHIGEQCLQHDSTVGRVLDTINKHHDIAPNTAEVPSIESHRDDLDSLFSYDDDFTFNAGDDEPLFLDNHQPESLSSNNKGDAEADRRESPPPRVTPTDPDTPIPSIEPHDPVDAENVALPVPASKSPAYNRRQMSRWPAWLRKLHGEKYWQFKNADPSVPSVLEVNVMKVSESSGASKTSPSKRTPKSDRGHTTIPRPKPPQENPPRDISSHTQHQTENPRTTAAMATLKHFMGDIMLRFLSFLPTPTNNQVNAAICKNIGPLVDKCNSDPEFGASVVFCFFQRIMGTLQRQWTEESGLKPEDVIEALQKVAVLLKRPPTEDKELLDAKAKINQLEQDIQQLSSQLQQAQSNSRDSSPSSDTTSASTPPTPANLTSDASDGPEDLGWYCMLSREGDRKPCLGHNDTTSKSNGNVTIKRKCSKCKRNVNNQQRLKVTRAMFSYNSGMTELRAHTPTPQAGFAVAATVPANPSQSKKRQRQSSKADESPTKKAKPHGGFEIAPGAPATLRFVALGATRRPWMEPKKPQEPVIDLTEDTEAEEGAGSSDDGVGAVEAEEVTGPGGIVEGEAETEEIVGTSGAVEGEAEVDETAESPGATEEQLAEMEAELYALFEDDDNE